MGHHAHAPRGGDVYLGRFHIARYCEQLRSSRTNITKKYDGSGYPHVVLQGEEIHVYARIGGGRRV